MKSKTAMAIKRDNGSISAWAKKYGFHVGLVSNIFGKYGQFGRPGYVPAPWAVASKIILQAATEGYKEELSEDGWEFNTDGTASTLVGTRREFITAAQNYLCELGDEYICNVFYAEDPEGGPLAILHFLETCDLKSVTAALNIRFAQRIKFYYQDPQVITVWTN